MEDIQVKPSPKKYRARIYMMRTGMNGWTENEILIHCRLSSGRNYATELERYLAIRLERTKENNPDGIGAHYRYRFVCREDVNKVVELVGLHARAGSYTGLSAGAVVEILNLYPPLKLAGGEHV